MEWSSYGQVPAVQSAILGSAPQCVRTPAKDAAPAKLAACALVVLALLQQYDSIKPLRLGRGLIGNRDEATCRTIRGERRPDRRVELVFVVQAINVAGHGSVAE